MEPDSCPSPLTMKPGRSGSLSKFIKKFRSLFKAAQKQRPPVSTSNTTSLDDDAQKQRPPVSTSNTTSLDDESTSINGPVGPIITIPAEILSQIFIQLSNPHIDSSRGYSPPNRKHGIAAQRARRLMLVCRTWRTVIKSAPQLWNTFALELIPTQESYQLSENASHRLYLCLKHSGSLPLDLCLCIEPAYWIARMQRTETVQTWEGSIRPVLARVECLTFDRAEDETIFTLQPAFHLATIFKDLEIATNLRVLRFIEAGFDPGLPIVPRPNLASPFLPSLRTLVVYQTRFPHINAPNLSDLFICGSQIAGRELCTSLATFLNLKHFTLREAYHMMLDDMAPSPGVPVLPLNTLELFSCDSHLPYIPLVRSNHLTSLTLDFHICIDQVPGHVFSSLVYLKLVGLSPSSIVDSTTILIPLLDNANILETFELHNTGYGHIDAILQAFLANPDGQLICPRLKRICIGGVDTCIVFLSILLRVLFQRINPITRLLGDMDPVGRDYKYGDHPHPNLTVSILSQGRMYSYLDNYLVGLETLRDADGPLLQRAIEDLNYGFIGPSKQYNTWVGWTTRLADFDIDAFATIPNSVDRLYALGEYIPAILK